MIKRFISFLIVLVMFLVVACGGGSSIKKKDNIKVLDIDGRKVNMYISSNINIGISNVKTAETIGTNPYIKKMAMGKFLVVDVFVQNKQKEAFTVSSSSFKIIDDQKREFSHSVEGEVALHMENGDNKGFLTVVNPGVGTIFTFVFDVPNNLNLDTAKLEARGSSGSKVLIPLTVQKQ